MPLELNLEFSKTNKVIVHFNRRHSDELNFKSPIAKGDHEDIQWYLEIYAAHYTTDVDDQRAERIAEKLPQWGKSLFKAVFKESAQSLYENFIKKKGQLLTISAPHPAILSLPWELLCDPQGTFLCHDDPHISIRRCLTTVDKVRKPFTVKPKARLRVLFVVSRPIDANFIDPRADPKAVLEALDEEASGRFEVEFLRPPTLENLVKRLECRAQYRHSSNSNCLVFIPNQSQNKL